MGVALAFVVILNGVFSFWQNNKSEAIMAKFKDFIPLRANVIRNSKRENIEAAHLVPGDIVEVISGEKIPADIRIISAYEMKVDNSSLTVYTKYWTFSRANQNRNNARRLLQRKKSWRPRTSPSSEPSVSRANVWLL